MFHEALWQILLGYQLLPIITAPPLLGLGRFKTLGPWLRAALATRTLPEPDRDGHMTSDLQGIPARCSGRSQALRRPSSGADKGVRGWKRGL